MSIFRKLKALAPPRQQQFPGMARAQWRARTQAFLKHPVWAGPASTALLSIRKSLEKKAHKPSREKAIHDLKRFERLLSFPLAVVNDVWRFGWAAVFIASIMLLTAWATGGVDRLAPMAFGAGTSQPRPPSSLPRHGRNGLDGPSGQREHPRPEVVHAHEYVRARHA